MPDTAPDTPPAPSVPGPALVVTARLPGMTSSLAGDEFADRFTTFRYTAYRLETLQAYDVPQEEDSLAAFLAGDPVSFGPPKDGWTAVIAEAEADGMEVSARIRREVEREAGRRAGRCHACGQAVPGARA